MNDHNTNATMPLGELYAMRLEICGQCTTYLRRTRIPLTRREVWRCGKCGCFLHAKAALRSEHCPINKW